MLQCMNIILPLIDAFSVNCGLGMIEAMIAPYLQHTGASNLEIGIYFMCGGLFFIIGSGIFGEVHLNFEFKIPYLRTYSCLLVGFK